MKKEEVTLVHLVKAGQGYNKEYRASYNRYRVIVESPQGNNAIEWLFDEKDLKELGYWSPRSKTMAMTCWGTSQEFEAQLALASWLGWKIEGEEWGDYTRRVTRAITVI